MYLLIILKLFSTHTIKYMLINRQKIIQINELNVKIFVFHTNRFIYL